jgi:hypothetical protein
MKSYSVNVISSEEKEKEKRTRTLELNEYVTSGTLPQFLGLSPPV